MVEYQVECHAHTHTCIRTPNNSIFVFKIIVRMTVIVVAVQIEAGSMSFEGPLSK